MKSGILILINLMTFADGNEVTASYGTATPKAHADTLFTAQDETDGLGTEGEVAN